MRRKTAVRAGLLLVVLAGGGAFAFTHGFGSKTSAPKPSAPTPVPIVAGTVEQHDVPIYLTGVGTVVAYNTDVVRSQIQGQIVSNTANRDRDQAQLTNAKANLNRYTPLAQKGWATPQLLDTQKAQVAQLEAAVKSDEALIESANVQLSYTRLTSPIDGVTGIRQIDVGNIISPANTNGVVIVTQLEPISLIFTLPETVLPLIQQQQQQKTQEPLAVLAYSQDNTMRLAQGTLGLVNNEILLTTGSIQLKANFPNKAHKLWPGELINARLLLDTRHDGLTVPASVVQQGPKGAYAYVVNPDSSVAIRPIKVAQVSDGQALIDSGLTANEQVVVDGQYKLQPGTHVTILHGQAAEEAAAQSAQQAPIP